jgi:hypothetical protein
MNYNLIRNYGWIPSIWIWCLMFTSITFFSGPPLWDSQMGISLLSQNFGCSYLSQIKFLEHVINIHYSSQKDISNGVSHPIRYHLTPALKGFVTLDHNIFFDHKLCISSLNEQCENILGIYASRTFHDILETQFNVCLPFQLRLWTYSTLLHNYNSQSGNTFGSHWVPSLVFSPICENMFHTRTHFLGLMGPCTPHLVINPMLGLQQHVNGGAS